MVLGSTWFIVRNSLIFMVEARGVEPTICQRSR